MVKLRPLIKYPGGKYYLAGKIVEIINSHYPNYRVFGEPFCGGANVLLQNKPAEVEFLNDIDPQLINLYVQIVKNDFFVENLQLVKYHQHTFENASKILTHNSGAVQALGYLIRQRMSRGGLGKHFAKSKRIRGGKMGDENAWDTFLKQLPQIRERLRNVVFHNMDAIPLMHLWDKSDVLYYLDPPYLPEVVKTRNLYEFGYTTQQHISLLKFIQNCKAGIAISGYHSKLYDESLRDWKLYEFNVANHSGQNKQKQRRVECLWIK
jgi:DNA adenine methylase